MKLIDLFNVSYFTPSKYKYLTLISDISNYLVEDLQSLFQI